MRERVKGKIGGGCGDGRGGCVSVRVLVLCPPCDMYGCGGGAVVAMMVLVMCAGGGGLL